MDFSRGSAKPKMLAYIHVGVSQPGLVLEQRRTAPLARLFHDRDKSWRRKSEGRRTLMDEGPKMEGTYEAGEGLAGPVRARNGEGLTDCRRPSVWSTKASVATRTLLRLWAYVKSPWATWSHLQATVWVELMVCPSVLYLITI
jgi:hypothetical protein